MINGFWYRTILWEVPLMSLISELYFKLTNAQAHSQAQIVETCIEKANIMFDILSWMYKLLGIELEYWQIDCTTCGQFILLKIKIKL